MDTYKEKYEKLVGAIKVLRDNNQSDEGIQNWVNDNVPEAAESKDERIRKALIRNFTNQHSSNFPTADGFTREQILAWLKKQKPIQNINKEDEEVRQYIIRIMKQKDINVPMVKKALAWLEKEGKSDKIVEKAKIEKQRVLVTESDGSANIDWDTRSLKDARRLLEYGLQYINTELEKQGKQRFDWSKEDSLMIEETLFFLREYQQSNRCKDENGMQNSVSCEKWLKSLKDRIQPKTTWKPSEEQMDALNSARWNAPFKIEILDSLCNDLKKLTE